MTEVSSVDYERFATVLMVNDEDDSRIEYSMDLPNRANNLTTLTTCSNEALHIFNTFNSSAVHLTAKDIVGIVKKYRLRELSLSYSLLSDELLKALSNISTVNLETIRIEAHPESKPVSNVSVDAWFMFSSRLPNVKLVVSSYMTREDELDSLIDTHVPITHLYLGESTPSTIISKVAANCPHLEELVIGAYGSESLDQILITAATNCPNLTAVGLGECEVTCSGFIQFVKLCCKRLQVLYVRETSLLEDTNCDVLQVISTVSRLLGRNWEPEYVPCW